MANEQQRAATSVSRGRITARVPANVVDMLEMASGLVGSTINQFVTQAALEKAEKVIAKEKMREMSATTTAWFFELLDDPPEPKQKLVDAFSRYKAEKVSADAGSNSPFEFKTSPEGL